jgi:ABC-type transport system involved in cytochrome c biogenesis permease subunit
VIAKLEAFSLASRPGRGALFLVTLGCIFVWVPTDAGLGLSQRIFYYHVPSMLTSFVGFAGGGIASAVFLKSGRSDWDHAANAAIGVGMLFATMGLLTGSIWARTAWGTWWTWDARLTTFLVSGSCSRRTRCCVRSRAATSSPRAMQECSRSSPP